MADEALIANAINLVTGFGGAIIGALVSGYVVKSHTKEIRTNQLRAEFFRLMIKSSLIQTDFVNLRRSINESIETADKYGIQGMPLWAKVQANPSDFEKISITPDELTCLFEAKEFTLLTGLVELGLRHTRLFEAFNTYSRLRSELKDHMPKTDFKGPVVGSILTQDDHTRLQPRLLELGSLLDSVVGLLPKYVSDSKSICDSIGPAARKYFNDPKFPTLAEV